SFYNSRNTCSTVAAILALALSGFIASSRVVTPRTIKKVASFGIVAGIGIFGDASRQSNDSGTIFLCQGELRRPISPPLQSDDPDISFSGDDDTSILHFFFQTYCF
ncbi:MAG: hypothetical protein V8S08_05910, partial [Lachnoclostridium sp.]